MFTNLLVVLQMVCACTKGGGGKLDHCLELRQCGRYWTPSS